MLNYVNVSNNFTWIIGGSFLRSVYRPTVITYIPASLTSYNEWGANMRIRKKQGG